MKTAEEYMAAFTPLNNAGHPLTEDEKREWWEAMNLADRIHEERKVVGKPMTLAESLREYHQRQNFIY